MLEGYQLNKSWLIRWNWVFDNFCSLSAVGFWVCSFSSPPQSATIRSIRSYLGPVPILLTLLFTVSDAIKSIGRPIISLNVTRRVRVHPKNTDPQDWASSLTQSDFIGNLDLLYQATLIIVWWLPHILVQSFYCVFWQDEIVSKPVKYSLYEPTIASKMSFLASNLFLFRPWLSILRPVYGFPSSAIFPNLGDP